MAHDQIVGWVRRVLPPYSTLWLYQFSLDLERKRHSVRAAVVIARWCDVCGCILQTWRNTWSTWSWRSPWQWSAVGRPVWQDASTPSSCVRATSRRSSAGSKKHVVWSSSWTSYCSRTLFSVCWLDGYKPTTVHGFLNVNSFQYRYHKFWVLSVNITCSVGLKWHLSVPEF